MVFINTHVQPKCTSAEKFSKFCRVRRVSVVRRSVAFVASDFNFVLKDEPRYDISTGKEKNTDAAMADRFATTMDNLTELRQDMPTRRRKDGDRISVTSRIDRIYTSIHPVDLMDMKIDCKALDNVFSSRMLSDHSPVIAKLHKPFIEPATWCIPHWMAMSEVYRRILSKVVAENGLISDSHRAVAETKAMMLEAAKKYNTRSALGRELASEVKI